MFEDANLFLGLDDNDDTKRIEAIDQLRVSVRQSEGELPVHNLTQLFQMLSDRVVDTNVDVAQKSAELLCDLLNRDLQTTDIYFPIVLPALFQTLSNANRRETSIHVLTTYVEAMGSVECVMEGLIQHGLKHDEVAVREETLLAIPTIAEGYLVPSASAGREDYMKLLSSMIDHLLDGNEHVVDAAEAALRFANDEDKNFWKHVERLGRPKLELVTKQFSSKARKQREAAAKAEVEKKVEKQDSPKIQSRLPFGSPIQKQSKKLTTGASVGGEITDTQTLLDKELAKAMERRARLVKKSPAEDKNDEEDKMVEAPVADATDACNDHLGVGSDVSANVEDNKEVAEEKVESEGSDIQNSEIGTPLNRSTSSSNELEDSNISTIIDAPDLGSPPGLKYGVLPQDIIDGLTDKDAWKVRATAVENFMSIVQKLSNEEVEFMKPHVEDLLEFMSKLLDDGNFKISITALQILSILCVRVGDEMAVHFTSILHSLVNRLGDNTIVARNTALEVFQQLLKVVGGGKVLDNLLVMLDNPNWYIREGIVKVAMQALLTRPIDELELPQLVVGLVHILHDTRPKVRFAVTEALAILHNRAGKEIDVLALVEGLDRSDSAEETINDLKARFSMPAATLPSMNSSGHVVYTVTGSYAPPPTPAGSSAPTNVFKEAKTDSMARSKSASTRRHPSAGRQSGKIPFNVPRPTRAATAGSNAKDSATSPKEAVRKNGPSTAIGNERDKRENEDRVWRQKDHVDRRLSELEGQEGRAAAPFQLHISDHDALDFDTYSKSLFEDPFEFQKSTVPPSPAGIDRSISEGGAGSPKREERRVRQFVASPLAADPRRNVELGTPKSRRGPRSVRSPFPFAASPELREKKDAKISLWLPDNEKERSGGSKGDASAGRSARGRQSSKADGMGSARSGAGNDSARGDHSARNRARAANGEEMGGLGIVGSGMSVQRNRGRGEEKGVPRRRGGPTPRGSAVALNDGKERRPRVGGREIGWEEEGAVSNASGPYSNVRAQNSPRVFEQTLARGINRRSSDPAQQVWPPKAPNDGGKRIARNGAREVSANSEVVDVRLSADDIRDRLRNLKSRGGGRQVPSYRAASASGVIESDAINELEIEDPRNLVRAETVAEGGSYSQQERYLAPDERPIRPAGKQPHYDPRFQSSASAPASTTAEDDWAAEDEYNRSEIHRRAKERKVSVATMRRREYLKQIEEKSRAKANGNGDKRTMRVSPRMGLSAPTGVKRNAVVAGGNRYGRSNAGRDGKPKLSPRPSAVEHEPPRKGGGGKEYDSSKRSAEYLASDEVKPLKNDVAEMRRAMKDLGSDQWDLIFDALNVVRALALHHQGTIGPALHGIVLSVNKASKNLRSAVAKNGLLTLNDMIDGLGPLMDPELDNITVHLLKRASESGTGFVGDEADRCLRSMCVSCSESKALAALLNCSNDKTPMMRAVCAQHIEYCVSQMGSRICGARDLNRLISACVKFITEAQQEARRAGRKIFYELHRVGAVTERQLRRLLQERELRQVMELIERGANGLPVDVRETQSRSMSRSRHSRSRSASGRGSRGGDRGEDWTNDRLHGSNEAVSGTDGRNANLSKSERGPSRDHLRAVVESQPLSARGGSGTVIKPEAPELELLMPNLLKHMGSTDWRRRQEAVISTVDLLSKHASTLAPNSERLMAAFDHFIPRLGDSNSKVCLTTLRALSELLPSVRSQITDIVPLLMSAAAANLASASKPILSAATNVLDMLESCVSQTTLFPPMISLCVHSNPRVQTSMLYRLSDLIPSIYDSHPRLVQRQAVPAILKLVNTARGELRMATNRALQMLYRAMGDDLVQAIRAAHIQSAAKDQALTSLGVM
jgi:hypothetical protein